MDTIWLAEAYPWWRKHGMDARVVQEAMAGDGAGPATHGAEEGISPGSPEAYEPDPEGPTTSTED